MTINEERLLEDISKQNKSLDSLESVLKGFKRKDYLDKVIFKDAYDGSIAAFVTAVKLSPTPRINNDDLKDVTSYIIKSCKKERRLDSGVIRGMLLNLEGFFDKQQNDELRNEFFDTFYKVLLKAYKVAYGELEKSIEMLKSHREEEGISRKAPSRESYGDVGDSDEYEEEVEQEETPSHSDDDTRSQDQDQDQDTDVDSTSQSSPSEEAHRDDYTEGNVFDPSKLNIITVKEEEAEEAEEEEEEAEGAEKGKGRTKSQHVMTQEKIKGIDDLINKMYNMIPRKRKKSVDDELKRVRKLLDS